MSFLEIVLSALALPADSLGSQSSISEVIALLFWGVALLVLGVLVRAASKVSDTPIHINSGKRLNPAQADANPALPREHANVQA